MIVEPIYPTAFCERSVMRSLSSSANRVNRRSFCMSKSYVFRIIFIQTWSVLELNKNPYNISNLLPNTMYRICMKCRQAYSDPEGIEQCQTISTNSRFRKTFHKSLLFRERHSFFILDWLTDYNVVPIFLICLLVVLVTTIVLIIL